MARIVVSYRFHREEQRFVVPTNVLDKIGKYFKINPRLISKRYPLERRGTFFKGNTISDCRKVYWLWLSREYGFSALVISRIEGVNHSTIGTALDNHHLIEDDYKKIFNEEEKEDSL